MFRLGVWPIEQVTSRHPLKQRPPALPLMLWPVTVHVAPLAERREVGVRVAVAVSYRWNHTRRWNGSKYVVSIDSGTDDLASAIAPGASLRVPPAAIAEMPDGLPVRSLAALAAALGAAEADPMKVCSQGARRATSMMT